MKNYINIALSILAATCVISHAATYQGQATGADLDRTHLTLGAGIAEAGKVLAVNNDLNVSNINKLAAIELGVPNITLVSTSTAIRLSTTATLLWGNDTSPNAVLGQSSGDSIYLRHVPTPSANAVTNSIVLGNSSLDAVMSNTNLLSIAPTRVALGAWNPVTASNAYLGGVLGANWSNAIVPFISISATNLTLGNRFTSITDSNGTNWSYLSSGLTLGPMAFSPSTAFTGNASAALVLSNGNFQIIGKGFSSAGIEGLRGYPNNVIIGAGENGSGWYSAGSNSMPFIRFVRSVTNSAYPDGQPRSMAIYPSPYSNWLCIVPGTIANGSTLIGGDPGTVILDTSNAKYFNVATNYIFGAGITGNFNLASGTLSMYGDNVSQLLVSNSWLMADSTTNYVRRTGDSMTGALDGQIGDYNVTWGYYGTIRTNGANNACVGINSVADGILSGMRVIPNPLIPAQIANLNIGTYYANGTTVGVLQEQCWAVDLDGNGAGDFWRLKFIDGGTATQTLARLYSLDGTAANAVLIITNGVYYGDGVGITNLNTDVAIGNGRLSAFLGIYTNKNPTTVSGVTNGAYFLDSGSNTVNFSINGTWKYVKLNNF